MPQEQQIYDIGIIGGGPAGYTAAFEAGKQGLSVVLFEKDKIGGVCLNKGCIPTKAILHSAELYEEMKCANELGICANEISFDYEKVIEHKDKVVEKIRKNLELALKNAGVKVVYGEAVVSEKLILEGKKLGELEDKPLSEEQRAGNQEGKLVSCYCEESGSPTRQSINNNFLCKKLIIATGSEPKDFPTLKFDHKFVLNSDDILNLKKLPKNILIIGSGAIGIEWARIFSAFNVDVSIVETAEHLLPIADIEVSKRIERIFKTKKIKMYLSNTVEKIKDKKVYLKSNEILEPECVLLAVGRKPIILENWHSEDWMSGGMEDKPVLYHCEEGDNPTWQSIDNDNEKIGLLRSAHNEKNNIGASNDVPYSTHNTHSNDTDLSPYSPIALSPSIIIGDACGKIQLAHFAIKQAIKEISRIEFDETLVPSVIYGNPEIAWIGKREQELEEGTYKKSNLLISALGKSHCDNSTDGFIKILSQNGKIIGAHIVSKEASSLIQELTIAMQNNISVDDLKKVCFAHPTYSEGIFECLIAKSF